MCTPPYRVLLGKNSFMDTVIMFAGILQLNAMHIGNNKNFAILLQNEKNTKVLVQLYIIRFRDIYVCFHRWTPHSAIFDRTVRYL